MYSPALFFLSSATSASRPITKFLVTIYSKSCPTIEKLPERTVCVQSREFLDGWNNLCIPDCLKFNYKMFIPASRPITKFLVTIYSKSCPTIEKLPERTVCVQSREFLDGWNNLCIPDCLKFNYKVFIPTSLGRRLHGPAHKKRMERTTMYSLALFFCPVPPPHPGLSRNFWLQYAPHLAPTIEKLSERTVCVQSREFLDGWNNLCIPDCLKFNYKMFIPTSLGRRLFGPVHKERVGRTTMYSPALFFLSSTTSASQPASNL